MIDSIEKQFYTATNFIYCQFDQGVKYGAKISKSLTELTLTIKIVDTALKVLECLPIMSEIIPFGIAYPLLKDVKRVDNLFKGFQSIYYSMHNLFQEPWKKENWKLKVLNIAGLSLFCFTIIDIAARVKVNVSAIYGIFKKIPIFGVLPFAGLVNLSTVTLVSMLFLMALDKQKRLNSQAVKLNDRLKTADFKEFANKKVEEYQSQENKEFKLKKWIAIQGLPNKEIERYFDGRKTRLESKLDKNKLEKTSNRLSLIGCVIKISAIAFSTFVILTGLGLPALFATTLTLGVLEVSFGITNYFLKKRVTSFDVKQNPFPLKACLESF